MSGPLGRVVWLVPALLAGACAGDGGSGAQAEPARDAASAIERDAELLGREILELVDRAADYKGSHQGRPAASFRQMGIDSLTPTTIRRIANPGGRPTVTVVFRNTASRAVVSCRGDTQLLEDVALQGDRYTLSCVLADGTERLVEVGGSRDD